MEWRDEAIVLSARRHGERGVILDALTREHGRHAGLVRYGTSRRLRGVLEPGNQISVRWHARLAEQLGQYTVEPMRSRAGVLSDPLRLAGLSAACPGPYVYAGSFGAFLFALIDRRRFRQRLNAAP